MVFQINLNNIYHTYIFISVIWVAIIILLKIISNKLDFKEGKDV